MGIRQDDVASNIQAPFPAISAVPANSADHSVVVGQRSKCSAESGQYCYAGAAWSVYDYDLLV